jgi:hypothetical protein
MTRHGNAPPRQRLHRLAISVIAVLVTIALVLNYYLW